MVVEETLKACGDFGTAQWLMLTLFSIVNILSALHYFAQTFITLGSHCTVNYTDENYSNNDTKFNTLSLELGWVCGDSWKSALVQSMFFVGSVLGTLIIGILSDTFGRRPMLVISNFLALLGNLLTAYLPPSLIFISTARFVAGLAVDSNFFMMYILVMEYMSPGMRTLGLNLCIGIWYCIGCMVTPWLAILCSDWRTFLLVISVPMILIPIFTFIIPESAQWLISRGKIDGALDNYLKIAKINGKILSPEIKASFKTAIATNEGKTSSNRHCSGLFITPKLRRKTCILIFKTMVLTLCYDAISRNIEGLGYDPFVMFTISSATILPSCLVILLVQDRIGRKAIAIIALFICGLLNLTQGNFHQHIYTSVFLSILSRFSVNIAYNSGTQYAAELIPAQVRGQGLSMLHVIGYIAAFFSPQILYSTNSWEGTPEVILGVLSVLGALLCFFLPETLGRTLPITLEEGETFGENEKFWEFSSNFKHNRQQSQITKI